MEKINFNDLPSTDTPINSSNLNQLQTNVENEINFIDNKFNYSTTEHAIGTWIDGKTLYRRVYDCGNLGVAGTKETPTNLSNVNYVDWEGVALASGAGTAYPYKMAVTGNDYGAKVEVVENKIRIKTIVDLYDYTGYVTILYTKN